jgi:hypothetical protein
VGGQFDGKRPTQENVTGIGTTWHGSEWWIQDSICQGPQSSTAQEVNFIAHKILKISVKIMREFKIEYRLQQWV